MLKDSIPIFAVEPGKFIAQRHSFAEEAEYSFVELLESVENIAVQKYKA